jgi:hypothetical protein
VRLWELLGGQPVQPRKAHLQQSGHDLVDDHFHLRVRGMEAARDVAGALASELDGVRVDHRTRRVEDVPGEGPVVGRAGGAVKRCALLDGVAAAVDGFDGVARPFPRT